MTDQRSIPASAGWGTIVLIYLICVLGAASIGQAIPIVGDIARFFHGTRGQVSWVISMPSALVALGALPIGWLVARLGDKPLILLGIALLILGDCGVTLAESMPVLLLMRAVEGLGYALVAVSSVTMIARVTQGKRRTSALTLWSSYIPMSFAIPLTLAGLLAGTGHWRWSFGGHALTLLVLGLAGLSLPARESAARTAGNSGLSMVLRTPVCYALGVSFACTAFVQLGIMSTLAPILAMRYGFSIAAASSLLTAGSFINIFGCLLMGWLLNRGLSPLLSALGSVALAAASASIVYVPGVPVAAELILAATYFLGTGLLTGLWALMPAVAPTPASRGATSGLVTQLTLWGVLFGPPVAFAAQAHGEEGEIGVILIAYLLGALLTWWVIHRVGTRIGLVDPGAGH
jgi:predicted MFS family arabinose efflux permease